MSLFALFSISWLTFESVFSPAHKPIPAISIVSTKPEMTFGAMSQSNTGEGSNASNHTAGFGQLIAYSANATVLGTSTASESATVSATPEITAVNRVSKKKSYTIALLGDSMTDTLGPGVPQLADELKKVYPETRFNILNYGVGGTNVDYGLERLEHDYQYLGKPVPALISQKPDLVVVESFGYNPYPFNEGALEKHWLAINSIVKNLKQDLPEVKIVIAATIAPNNKVFGDGAAGLSFSIQDKKERTAVIKKYIESTISYANGEHLPLADAYHDSLDDKGNGKLEYINPGDHMHYSDAGKILMAQKITRAIVQNQLLE